MPRKYLRVQRVLLSDSVRSRLLPVCSDRCENHQACVASIFKIIKMK